MMQSCGQWRRLVQRAEPEVDAVRASLPEVLAEMAGEVPVVFEPAPSQALVADGLAPDTLGLFVGLSYAELDSGAHDLPSQILLFLENIWFYAGGDPQAYREEVRKTYVHELGHYLGMDEEDLWERGLE